MNKIVNLLFEAKILKEIPRTGYHFLGSGKESVAEHSFLTTFIAYVMSRMESDIDAFKLVLMCLLHDLPEARIGDFNYLHKKYATAHEDRAIADLTEGLFFGNEIKSIIEEFNKNETIEAKLAKDADQLSLILGLKALQDKGKRGPEKWLPSVIQRLQTETAKRLAQTIIQTEWDDWWFKKLTGDDSKNMLI